MGSGQETVKSRGHGRRLMEDEGVVKRSPERVARLVVRRAIDRSDELSRLPEDHDLAHADMVANFQPPRHAPHN